MIWQRGKLFRNMKNKIGAIKILMIIKSKFIIQIKAVSQLNFKKVKSKILKNHRLII